jgi:hypothetical protein
MQSSDPKKTMGASVLVSAGSFNTQLYGVRLDTGEVSQWGGLRAFISLMTLSSNGCLTNARFGNT